MKIFNFTWFIYQQQKNFSIMDRFGLLQGCCGSMDSNIKTKKNDSGRRGARLRISILTCKVKRINTSIANYDLSPRFSLQKIWVCIALVSRCFDFFGLFWFKSMSTHLFRMQCNVCSQYFIEFACFNHKQWKQSNKSLQ